jgi:predicted HicB family RNase H-like nuclease
MSKRGQVTLQKPNRFNAALEFGAGTQAKKTGKVMRLNADIPEELHRKIKVAAAQQGVTVKKLLLDMIKRHL